MKGALRRAVWMLLLVLAAPVHAQLTPDETLIKVAGKGELDSVNALLAAGADPNFSTISGTTALGMAIRGGHVPVIRVLLAAGAKVDPDGNSSVMAAASAGQYQVIPLLLAANARPDLQWSSGETPLFFAAQSGDLPTVELLLAAGANPNPRWKHGGGRTALLVATMQGHLDVALRLVKAGADGDIATDYSETPLRLASAGSTSRHLELVRALLAVRVDVEAGQPSTDGIDDRCMRSEVRCVRNVRRAQGTALGLAAESGSPDIVAALLAARAKVDARQPGLLTPLMLAAAKGRADVVELLLAAGADVNLKDSKDRTAPMLAAAHPQVLALLQSGQ